MFRGNTYDADVDSQPINSYSDPELVIQDYKKNKDEFKKYADSDWFRESVIKLVGSYSMSLEKRK